MTKETKQELFDLEDVYDNEISPLMLKIIKICKDNKMPMLCTFVYENDKEKGLGMCTSHINNIENRFSSTIANANNIIQNGDHQTFGITVTKG